jgi:O-antigen ligase
VVIGFGLLQIYVLPANWLVHFGYGPHTIVPYQLVDPAVKSIRILSTLGGPNQLGSFLLLPLSLVIWRLMHRWQWWEPVYIVAGVIVLWHSYSRSAVLGLVAVLLVLLALRLPRRYLLPLLIVAVLGAAIGVEILTTDANHLPKLQYYLFHQTLRDTGIQASTSTHASAFSQGLKVATQHPLGLGLGSAGPASFHSGHTLIPEDYYLQLAIETGVVGMVLFCALQLLVGWRLWLNAHRVFIAPALVATLAGIAVINLVLQGWADSSTALTFWGLAGSALGAADALVP